MVLVRIGGDGRFVAMTSLATNLVPNDTNNRSDVFLHDRVTGSTSRTSLGQGQVQANDHSYDAAISSVMIDAALMDAGIAAVIAAASTVGGGGVASA